jgi:hypothetical protein
MVHLKKGSPVLWRMLCRNSVRSLQSGELFCYPTQSNITVQQATEILNVLHDIFQLPNDEAFQQFLLLSTEIANLLNTQEKMYGPTFGVMPCSQSTRHKALTGHMPTHPVFTWLWGIQMPTDT